MEILTQRIASLVSLILNCRYRYRISSIIRVNIPLRGHRRRLPGVEKCCSNVWCLGGGGAFGASAVGIRRVTWCGGTLKQRNGHPTAGLEINAAEQLQLVQSTRAWYVEACSSERRNKKSRRYEPGSSLDGVPVHSKFAYSPLRYSPRWTRGGLLGPQWGHWLC